MTWQVARGGPRSDGCEQRRFLDSAQNVQQNAVEQGDAPCLRYRNVPIRLYWFMASG